MRKIVDGFKTSGGKHCITTALKQVLSYYDCDLSEEMLFGLGSGLSFIYLNLEKAPMVGGRSKPFEFEKKLGERLNIEIKCKTSSRYENAHKKTINMIHKNEPVMVYVDMPYLKYLNLDEENHFGGHAVVIFGYDNENKQFLVSDRDNSDFPIHTKKGEVAEDYHLVSFEEIEKARSSTHRPFPAKNKFLQVKVDKPITLDKGNIISAVKETCDNMLNPPAKLLGLNGIEKFSKEILKWSKFHDEKFMEACISNHFMISKKGGTGGGIFRNMYGRFLMESGELIENKEMVEIGEKFIEISKSWDDIGDMLWDISESLDRGALTEISKKIEIIHKMERKSFEDLSRAI